MKVYFLPLIVMLIALSSKSTLAKPIATSLQEYQDIYDQSENDWRMKLWDESFMAKKLNNFLFDSTTQGAAHQKGWSGSSWSYNRGGTALRYNDQDWKNLTDRNFTDNTHEILFKKFEQDPPKLQDFVTETSKYSPVERYDMLLDDSYFGLTHSIWEKIFGDFESYKKATGSLPDYFGYCDGWAIASAVHDKPVKPVTLTSAEGREITFNVPDIRALTSMYHQQNPNLRYRVLGSRCNRNKVGCSYVNPGLFHLAVLNRVGRDKKPLLFDSSGDSSVWNKVIQSFSVKYFNPHNDTDTKKKGLDINKYKNSYFRPKFQRAASATHTVGVELKLSVVRLRTQYDQIDAIADYFYYYELELDARNEVVGGEWLYMAGGEPDFLWYVEDNELFDTVEPSSTQLPQTIKRKALHDAHVRGNVHPWIIKELIERSSN